MKPTGEAEEMAAKEQLKTVNGGRDKGGRMQLVTVGKTVTKQGGMEKLPQRPMPHPPNPTPTQTPHRVKGFKSSKSVRDKVHQT